MVSEATARLTRYGGSRHCLYLRSDLVSDSAFPFNPGESLHIRIDGDRLVVSKEQP